MTKVVLFVIAGIVALNVALLAGAVVVAALDRRRRRRDIRDLEVIWHMAPARAPRGGSRTGKRGSAVATRQRGSAVATPSTAISRPTSASAGRKLVGAMLVAALAFVGTASASPRAREVVASVLTTVTQGIGLQDFGPPSAASTDDATGAGTLAAGRPSTDAVRTAVPSPSGGHRGGSAASSSASSAPEDAGASTIADPGAPPTGATTVTATAVSSSAVEVDWTDVTGETGYRLERSSDGATGWAAVARLPENATAALDSGLSPNTTYFYRVVATTDGGDASVSDVASVTTWIAPADAPIVAAVAVSSSQVDLSWVDVASETGYRIERSVDGTSDWVTITTTGQDVTGYSDTGLTPGTKYSYRVVATNTAGDSEPSAVVSATTASETPTDAPSAAPAG